MTKLEGITNDQMTNYRDAASSLFGLCASFVIRDSCFIISRRVILMLIVQTWLAATVTQAESPNMIGKWNVEITFSNADHRSLRFDAQGAGKGTLLLLDPRSNVWEPAGPSAAKWTQGEGNSVTFSGAVEFLIGNVGRDAGTLVFKGKFGTDGSITGEVAFFPLDQDPSNPRVRSSRSGTFKAIRATDG
jgi:hypothetical protein